MNVNLNQIVEQFMNNFDFAYMFVVNILTYIIIKVIDAVNKEKVVNTWQKRIVLCAAIVIVTSLYGVVGYDQPLVLINSAIVAPVAWSWVFKPILAKIGIGYNKKEN